MRRAERLPSAGLELVTAASAPPLVWVGAHLQAKHSWICEYTWIHVSNRVVERAATLQEMHSQVP